MGGSLARQEEERGGLGVAAGSYPRGELCAIPTAWQDPEPPVLCGRGLWGPVGRKRPSAAGDASGVRGGAVRSTAL